MYVVDGIQDEGYPHGHRVEELMQTTYNSRSVSIYNINYPSGTVPEEWMGCHPVVRRCWFVSGSTETGFGLGTNRTDIEFRIGDFTNYTVLGTIPTWLDDGSPTGRLYQAGESWELKCWWPVTRPGELLYARATRIGLGLNYNNKIVHFGHELAFVRSET